MITVSPAVLALALTAQAPMNVVAVKPANLAASVKSRQSISKAMYARIDRD
jgi:hypothetical protein